MIVGATVERFRGLQRLEVDGFGRVNLIVGKNECGKTALMEALAIAEEGDGASACAFVLQGWRRSQAAAPDFDRFWRPLFWNQDAARGFTVKLRGERPEKALCVEFRKGETPPLVLTRTPDASGQPASSWAIDVRVNDGQERVGKIVGSAGTVTLPPPPRSGGAWWVPPCAHIDREEIRLFSKLKQNGAEAQILPLLRELDPRVEAIEIFAPTGTDPEVWARFEASLSPLLPLHLSSMGEGFQRCFVLGVAAAANEWPFLFIDEFDNGLHHATLEPVWRWLAAISKKRDLQVFATTHSEECVHAAAHAFAALDDDDLRVIRLDRHEDRTTAAIYSRELIEASDRMGIEVRG